jgi:hypothetical protein
MKNATKTLDPTALYLGDNGRAFCGALKCAGMTAHFTGRTLSGDQVALVPARDAQDYGLCCESCGMKPSLILVLA